MIVTVNEQQVEVDEQTTVAGLLESLGFPDRGVAVAWTSRCYPDPVGPQGFPMAALRLEVVTAVQGG